VKELDASLDDKEKLKGKSNNKRKLVTGSLKMKKIMNHIPEP
jgi:hypothetical protein